MRAAALADDASTLAVLVNSIQSQGLPMFPQGNVLRAAALAGDAGAAGALCALVRANPPAAASGLDPDWRGAAYITAVVQPAGCNLKGDGANLP